MKNNMLKKILSIALVVLLSGIIPSAAAFAASIVVDVDFILKTSETEVDLGVLNYNQSFSRVVKVYVKGGSIEDVEINTSGTGGLTATGGTLSGSGWSNAIDSTITGIAITSGEFFITWSSNEDSLKNNPAILKVKFTVRPNLEVTWPTANEISYGQSLSESTLVNGTANMVGTFAFDAPEDIPDAGNNFHKIWFIPNDLENYSRISNMVQVVTNQATPVVTWPTASSITYGKSLSYSTLNGGSSDVDGSFVFDDPNFKPEAGASVYLVKFLPLDSNNYKQISNNVDVETLKANAIINIDGFIGTYDGKPHGASGTALGMDGVDLKSFVDFGETFTNVSGGTAYWTFDGGDNYNDDEGSVEIVINKARATVSISGVTVDYDGYEHGATGTATSVDGVDLTRLIDFGEKFKYVPGGAANWTFDGGDNYHDDGGSVQITIKTMGTRYHPGGNGGNFLKNTVFSMVLSADC